MSDADDALEWVKYAEEDLILAKSALRRSKPLTMGSCFHSQQCAEKYLKAILVSKDAEFPKTHDLLILDGLCKAAGILTGFTKEDLGRLSGYAVRTRYPGNQPVPKEAREALEIAMQIRRFARAFLGLKR
ncbi:MAG: HEPN domain-containing protein [Anaerolineae bacterium]|nr:HEPN domain-containing protein [Anaerolineae bacterium]MBL8107530.1 HEPN domain-containing protein [Anaerolineales bacterium]MCC7190414.1 HEPN domain-containing protein [Anaerolineales bacterium]